MLVDVDVCEQVFEFLFDFCDCLFEFGVVEVFGW